MKIVCPNCRVPVAAEDIDLSSGLAKCRTCNNVFRFTDTPELAAPAAAPRPAADRPGNVVISETPGGLALDYRWFSPKYIFMAFFCLFWDGFLVFWYTIGVGTGNLIMLLFPILHVAVGIGITYVTVAGFVNTTSVRIDRSRIRVWHHPLPFGRRIDIETGAVKQLFCEERINRGRNGVWYSYDLLASLKDGTRKRLLANADTPQLPVFLEQHAESWLGIRDEPVIGEMAR
ncbi:MAG: hypothetical protein JO306_08920 [Gemmatimonadetes bacterium]|nr:hypothetical protein [Gemmatimonadota bacterium]